MRPSGKQERRYTEEEVKSIFELAISKSDLESALWSRDDLIKIAAELDIPERILAEALEAFEREQPPRIRRFEGTDLLKVAVGGSALGAAAVLGYPTIAAAAAGLMSIALSLDCRRREAYLRYAVRNGALWLAFYGTIRLQYDIELSSAAVLTAMCLGAGAVAMALMRALSPGNPITGFGRRVMRKLSERLRLWSSSSEEDGIARFAIGAA